MDIYYAPNQREFNKACQYGNLELMQDLLERGAIILPISISLVGENYPNTIETFEWLLERSTDIDWTYICNNPYSVEMARKIVNKGISIIHLPAIASHHGDIPLLKFAISHIGWKVSHLYNIIELCTITEHDIEEQCNLFEKGLKQLDLIPTLKMVQTVKKFKNKKLAQIIYDEYHKEHSRNAFIKFWKRNSLGQFNK